MEVNAFDEVVAVTFRAVAVAMRAEIAGWVRLSRLAAAWKLLSAATQRKVSS